MWPRALPQHVLHRVPLTHQLVVGDLDLGLGEVVHLVGRDHFIAVGGALHRHAGPDAVGEAVANADLVVLAVPLGAYADLAPMVAPNLKKGAILSDVGSVKQAVIRRTLALRRERPLLFAQGAYWPLRVSGTLGAHVVAFLRSCGDQCCLVVVPRLVSRRLDGDDSILMDARGWGDTVLHLPEDARGHEVRDVLTDECIGRLAGELPLARVLGSFPVAVWG